MNVPDDLKYSEDHEWVRQEGTLVRFGITDYAQDALGDVVYVDVPEPGTAVTSGQPFGEVESTKSVSDIYSPVSGVVAAKNVALDESAELVNQAPYGDGWIAVIDASDAEELGRLLDAGAYRSFIEELSKD